jgi:putative selenium metabolism protein SsnA
VLLKGATLVALDPLAAGQADLRLSEGRVVERAAALEASPGEEVVGLAGTVVLPGLVNAHTHLYSALARGMPPPAEAPRTFVEILERVWWRLDRALDEESVYLSALVGGIEAALSGTTFLVDHHSSPSFIRGSLKAVQRALDAVGIRSLLCYEVTDRNGTPGREAGLAENAEFLRAGATALSGGLVGAHASFTLSEEAMGALGALVRQSGRPLHVHVAEDGADVDDCRARYGESPVDRLRRHGLLPRALLAHCVRLAPEEAEGAQAAGAWIAHNPRSNMNNVVGYAPTRALRRAALGTDGMDQDLLAEARTAFLQMREAGRDDAFPAALALLAGGHRLAAAFTGQAFGALAPGAPADLVVLDYRPPTPLDSGNAGGHLLFGCDRSHVRDVMVAGRWIVRGRRLLTVDVEDAFARARAAARGLWERMARIQ